MGTEETNIAVLIAFLAEPVKEANSVVETTKSPPTIDKTAFISIHYFLDCKKLLFQCS